MTTTRTVRCVVFFAGWLRLLGVGASFSGVVASRIVFALSPTVMSVFVNFDASAPFLNASVTPSFVLLLAATDVPWRSAIWCAYLLAPERDQNDRPRELLSRAVEKGQDALRVPCPGDATPSGLFLVGTYDAERSGQSARLKIGAREAGAFYSWYRNPYRRWAQDGVWLELKPGDCQGGSLALARELEGWTESAYEALFY